MRKPIPTDPLNVYGRTKLAGEKLIAASGCVYLILRTTWVYDIRGKNFLRTALRLAREREELRMVGDEHGSSNLGPYHRREHRSNRHPARARALCVGMGTKRHLSPYRRRPDDLGWLR